MDKGLLAAHQNLARTTSVDGVAEKAFSLRDGLAEELFQLSPAAQVLTTADPLKSTYLVINNAYAALTGFQPDAIIGAELLGRVAIGDDARHRRMHLLETVGHYQAELAVIRHASGRPLDVMISARRMRIAGEAADLEVLTDVSDRMALQSREIEALRRAAKTDPLTGVCNRGELERRLDQCLSLKARGTPFSVALLDLNGFKRINDVHGHLVGDQILRDCARRLQSHLGPDDFFARFGGDEFAFLLRPRGWRPEQVEARLTSILERSFRVFQMGELVLEVGAALGICHSDEGFSSRHDLLSAADQRMYAAKATGRRIAICGSPSGL